MITANPPFSVGDRLFPEDITDVAATVHRVHKAVTLEMNAESTRQLKPVPKTALAARRQRNQPSTKSTGHLRKPAAKAQRHSVKRTRILSVAHLSPRLIRYSGRRVGLFVCQA